MRTLHRGVRVLPLLLLLASGLAGCASEDAPDRTRDEDVPQPFDTRVVLSYNMTSSCAITELSLPGSREDAERFLPEGLAVAGGANPFAVVVETCEDIGDNMALVVRIERPRVAARVHENVSATTAWFERPLCDAAQPHDEYFVAGYSTARFWVERYRQAGVPTVPATITSSTGEVDNPVRGLALAQGEATEADESLFSFDAAVAEGGGLRTCRSTWYQTDHGLLLVDEWRHSAGASTGPAMCQVTRGTPFAWVLDEAACARGSATVSVEVARTGYAFWFHETFVSR